MYFRRRKIQERLCPIFSEIKKKRERRLSTVGGIRVSLMSPGLQAVSSDVSVSGYSRIMNIRVQGVSEGIRARLSVGLVRKLVRVRVRKNED